MSGGYQASVLNCQRKVRHRTEAKALRIAARCAGKHGVRSLHVYHCPHCHGWHLTSQSRRHG